MTLYSEKGRDQKLVLPKHIHPENCFIQIIKIYKKYDTRTRNGAKKSRSVNKATRLQGRPRPPARVRHCRRKSSGSHTSELQCAFHSPLSVSPSAMSPGLALVQQSSLDPDRAGQLEPRRDEFMRVRAVALVGCGRDVGQ